jgi:ABC-type hemin transport system substrate-binding protein
VDAVEKARAVLERLDRIDGLRSEEARAAVLLEEVRALLSEAEEWVREESPVPSRTLEALERSREALAAGEHVSAGALVTR